MSVDAQAGCTLGDAEYNMHTTQHGKCLRGDGAEPLGAGRCPRRLVDIASSTSRSLFRACVKHGTGMAPPGGGGFVGEGGWYDYDYESTTAGNGGAVAMRRGAAGSRWGRAAMGGDGWRWGVKKGVGRGVEKGVG